MKYRENDIAYIVENNLRVTKVRVIRAAGGRCTVSPGEGKAMRLPEGRLYECVAYSKSISTARKQNLLRSRSATRGSARMKMQFNCL